VRDPIDERDQPGQLAERLASIRELEERAIRIAAGDALVHITLVTRRPPGQIALIRERGREAAMARRDRPPNATAEARSETASARSPFFANFDAATAASRAPRDVL